MTIEERIKERIAELQAERDKFVADANTQVTAYNAVIAELEKLSKEEVKYQSD